MKRVFSFRRVLQAKKTVLITGANKGIGKEVARQLATRGFQVFVGSRDEARGQKTVDELRAAGLNDVHLLVIDVTSDESVKSAAETLASKISALDILVNNAGIIAAGFKLGLQESLAEVQETYSVNVFGVIRTIIAFVDLLKKSKAGGRIINVTSGLGSLTWANDKTAFTYNYNAVGYNSSKSALNMITVSYAKALAEFNIKVNAACPGYTATDLNNNTGTQTVEEGATAIVHLATVGDDGPTGTYINKDGPIPW